MKHEIIPFEFKNKRLRTAMVNGEPWVVAKDVCQMLGLGNPSEAVRNLDDDERGSIRIIEGTSGLGGNPNMVIVNESGFYAMILRSRKPEARAIRKWVTSVVLPQLFRKGTYSAPAVEELKKSLMIAVSERNTYKGLWEEERRTVKRHERRNFLTNEDKREILTLRANGYPLSAIRDITKKGRTRIKNFIDEVLAMDDAAMDAMFAEWERAESLGRARA